MSSLNKVTLIGRVGKDPEVKSFQNGDKVCKLSLATSETWRDKASGERKEKTEWHTVVIYNEHIAKVAEQYVTKGSQIYIEGSLQTRKYEKDGSERYATEIVLQKFNGHLVLLDKVEKGEARSSAAPRQASSSVASRDLDSDEIPF